ncbi:hypothetical protein J2S15_003334 [Breznakia pachnodae]|uniref:Uncharacterized protein n=1 Tax=Breznakia pachnodae TaxID=265178 RepID=A0ABU0E6Z5_9FIRM|nr:hypothetical protein [Breznakia pachnodae]
MEKGSSPLGPTTTSSVNEDLHMKNKGVIGNDKSY